MPLPKIFVFKAIIADGPLKGFPVGYACAEDGSMLRQHIFSGPTLYMRQEMGLTGKGVIAAKYNEYYPDGYDLVDLLELSNEQLDVHPGLNAALDKGIDRAHP